MTPTVEEPEVRNVVVLLNDGRKATFAAQTLCKPDDSHSTYRFKRDGMVVAEFAKDAISGWHIHGMEPSYGTAFKGVR